MFDPRFSTLAKASPSLLLCLDVTSLVVASVNWPAKVHAAWRTLSAPFRNFVSLDDLSNPVDLRPPNTTFQTRFLMLLACLQAACWCGSIGFALYLKELESLPLDIVYCISWSYITLSLASKPPLTVPYLFVAFSSTLTLIALHNVVDAFLSRLSLWSLVAKVSFLSLPATFVAVAGSLPLKPYRPVHVAKSGEPPSSDLSCPEDDVTLWSWSSFCFVEPIMKVASSRTLQDSDVWSLSPFFLHKNIFSKCLQYRSQNPTHSLLRFLIVSNSLDLIIDVTLELWSAIVGFVPAYALQEILAALAINTPESRSEAYLWTFLTFFAHLSFAQMDLYQAWHTRRCYERTRGQLFCALHYKALKREEISGHVVNGEEGEEAKAELGKIVNLMQGDSYAVAQRFWEFSGLFSAPLRIAIALVFLYRVLGWSAFVGVAVALVAFALNYPLGRYNVSITRSSWKAKDRRMRLVNELLQNIRFLKFYGWEYDWSRKTEEAREDELRWQVKSNAISTAVSFIWFWMPSATALLCFLCYTLIAGEKLTVSKAFTSIALFSSLQGPMLSLPGQIFAILHAYVSMQRIEAFLSENEVPDWASCLGTREVHPPASSEVGFSQATFEWESRTEATADTSPRFQLGPLDFKFPLGALTIVSGPTGSGKSALLDALLGELHCVSGTVLIDKSNHQVAYCGQTPWLEHATIRDNIVFGSSLPFDEDRYRHVLNACALDPDLAILAAGDMTEIGEKGITLSGGQRARVALARAMYSRAKVILLDDPLAAVDMHTAQHIVNNCFSGELACGRTFILVTHHISLCLPVASYLVELEKGHVRHHGTIRDLQAQNILMEIIQADDDPESPINKKTDDKSNGFGAPKPGNQANGNGKLIEAEHRAEGRVTMRTYLTYVYAAGIHCWVVTVLLQVLLRLINVGNQVFLAHWGKAYEESAPEVLLVLASAIREFKWPWDDLPSPNVDVKPWLLVYFYISAAGAFTAIIYIIVGYYASLQASRTLFIKLLRRLTRAPLRFFDTTPVGRILNRFTSDINTIDGALQGSFRSFISGILTFLVSLGTILWYIPAFTPFAFFIAWLYLRLAPPYVNTARDLRRLESVSLSPAFAGFDELLRGITHIRAFGMENRYQERFYTRVDKFQSFDHVYWLVNMWLRWRYDCLGSLMVFAATYFALLEHLTDKDAAIIIVQAGIFAEANRQLVRVAAQLELDFNSVERVVEYLDVDQEAPAINPDYRPPAYWPSNTGDLRVEDLVVRYGPHLPPVLKNLTFTINPGEKIGVVGRTGSGKSTLVLALMRMLEPESGSIVIDGIDISRLGLEDLRTRMTIISQDVSLFSGTIRSNLDPLEKYTTEECQVVLDRCHLTSHFEFTPTPTEPSLLDMAVSQNSLSAGEKQLLALARAILRGTNIIIMDEATSQIDIDLDDKIQKTIREETAGAIVITIAHRLKTVIDYDRILVIDDGNIAEFDTPRRLLRKSRGVFRDICRRSADWGTLSTLARGSSEE